MLRFVLALFGALLGATTVASAQRAPDMATLDRGDGISKAGIDLALSSLDPPPYTSALRFDIYGQFVTQSGFGVYLSLPVSRSFGGEGTPSPPEAENATALGNLDAGLLYVQTRRSMAWVFRVGAALPTSSDGRDHGLTRYYATAPRLTDAALASSDGFLRLSVSPLIYRDRLFFRADLGFDLDFGDDDYHYLRLNVGGGVDLGVVALSLELANLAAFGDLGRDEDFVHTLAFTVRFMGKQLQPFLSVGAPLDAYRRDVVRWFLSGGLQVAF